MPRPLRSAVREGFVAALLLALLVDLPGTESALEVVVELLALCLLVGVAILSAPLRERRRPRSPVARVGTPRP